MYTIQIHNINRINLQTSLGDLGPAQTRSYTVPLYQQYLSELEQLRLRGHITYTITDIAIGNEPPPVAADGIVTGFLYDTSMPALTQETGAVAPVLNLPIITGATRYNGKYVWNIKTGDLVGSINYVVSPGVYAAGLPVLEVNGHSNVVLFKIIDVSPDGSTTDDFMFISGAAETGPILDVYPTKNDAIAIYTAGDPTANVTTFEIFRTSILRTSDTATSVNGINMNFRDQVA